MRFQYLIATTTTFALQVTAIMATYNDIDHLYDLIVVVQHNEQ
jgi:hypothetical protein